MQKTTARRRPVSSVPNVLAIDDEEVMGYLIQRIVRHLGYRVEWVTDCETALRRIGEERFDVILSDFRIPAMGGEQLYFEIAKRDQRLLSRLVFVTGDTVSTRTAAFLRKHNVRFLSKPFDIQNLQDIIESIVQQPSAPPVCT